MSVSPFPPVLGTSGCLQTGSTRSSQWREKTLTAAEVDLDLSPQLNPVLRRHIVYYVTTGIHEAVQQAAARAGPRGSRASSLAGSGSSTASQPLPAS